MSIIHKDKPYCVVVLTHRATGLFHLVLTTLTPSAYDVSSMVSYMNDFAKRTHRINNYALREFLNTYAPVNAADFDQRFLCDGVDHALAKATALSVAITMGTDKLLTAHTVKPAAWELNLLAKLRMQKGTSSPYTKATTASVPADQGYGDKPLTKAQFDAMCQHVCHGKSVPSLNVELEIHENTVATCHSTLPAWAWSKQRAVEIKEYLDVFSIYTSHGKYLY